MKYEADNEVVVLLRLNATYDCFKLVTYIDIEYKCRERVDCS